MSVLKTLMVVLTRAQIRLVATSVLATLVIVYQVTIVDVMVSFDY